MPMWLLPLLIAATTGALALPIGLYLAWIIDGRYRPPAWLRWFESQLDTGEQTWKQYAVSLLLFNTLLFVLAFALLSLQPLLPLNPDRRGMLAPTTIFHTAISFVTCNSQQHYAGEQHLSYFSQLAVIVANMFLSGGVSLCAAAAVIRGLRGDAHLGNFYLDLWRSVVYVLVPLSLLFGLLFLAAGTPMTFDGAVLAEPAGQRIARGPVAAAHRLTPPDRNMLATMTASWLK
jgi:K+-transporting ATPase ATPase A chain